MAYLRILCNPYDKESLKRVINYPPRGIGSVTQDLFFHDMLTTLVVDNVEDVPAVFDLLIELGTIVTTKQQVGGRKYKDILNEGGGSLNSMSNILTSWSTRQLNALKVASR